MIKRNTTAALLSYYCQHWVWVKCFTRKSDFFNKNIAFLTKIEHGMTHVINHTTLSKEGKTLHRTDICQVKKN